MKYICNHAVGCHGKSYALGDEIDLSAAEAKPLLACGAVVLPVKPSAFHRLFGAGAGVSIAVATDEGDDG